MWFDGRLILGCIALVGVSSTASAQAAPDGCNTDAKNARAYQQALTLGKNLANLAWSRVRNCGRLEQFVDTVGASIRTYRPATNNLQLVCRYTGFVDGVFEGIDNAFSSCHSQCCLEGEAIGEMAAQFYCDLSILLGGLGEPDAFVRGPTDTCGIEFQTCCDAAFNNVSRNYKGKDGSGKQVACKNYTVNSYREIWSGTREIECGYYVDPIDEEP